jgi:hypothetical protein
MSRDAGSLSSKLTGDTKPAPTSESVGGGPHSLVVLIGTDRMGFSIRAGELDPQAFLATSHPYAFLSGSSVAGEVT